MQFIVSDIEHITMMLIGEEWLNRVSEYLKEWRGFSLGGTGCAFTPTIFLAVTGSNVSG